MSRCAGRNVRCESVMLITVCNSIVVVDTSKHRAVVAVMSVAGSVRDRCGLAMSELSPTSRSVRMSQAVCLCRLERVAQSLQQALVGRESSRLSCLAPGDRSLHDGLRAGTSVKVDLAGCRHVRPPRFRELRAAVRRLARPPRRAPGGRYLHPPTHKKKKKKKNSSLLSTHNREPHDTLLY